MATLLANEGANVYSVNVDNVQTFTKFDKQYTDLKDYQVIPESDIVITGVPIPDYKVPTKLLKPGVVAINFSTFANFEADINLKASYFVQSIGKVTVAMLERNLLRLYDYQNQ